MAPHGMVATSHPLATQIGLEVLKKGGNAIDAAIAANAALTFMEPTGCGIGGDLFAIYYDAKTQKVYALDASGPAGSKASIEDLRRAGHTKMPSYGAIPVTVPGAVGGWFSLHDRFGKLAMSELLKPTIQYARKGVPVTPVIGLYLQVSQERYKDFANIAETWHPESRDMPREGEIMSNPFLADTLQVIADEGRDGFYRGRVADEVISFLDKHGGLLTLKDLADYSPRWVEPVSTSYRGHEVYELPPPTQGIAALQMLNILERFEIWRLGLDSPQYLHYLVESKKIAFADRARYYADPAFEDVPTDYLVSKKYAKARAKEIDLLNPALADVSPAVLEEGDTIYLAVGDDEGNMVSLIQSNYRGMGSGMVPPKLGFMLQNRGELFSLDSDHPNALTPGKRPFHTIIPAFVTRGGDPWLAFGVMGGATQPQAHVQILVNLIDYHYNLQEAGDAPRMVHTGSPQPTGEAGRGTGVVNLESGFSIETERELTRRGHAVQRAFGIYGGYQAVMRHESGYYVGASEARKDGQAAGY